MNRPKDTTDLMTERHWKALEDIQMRLSARRHMGQEYPQATAPWDRPEHSDRRLRRAA